MRAPDEPVRPEKGSGVQRRGAGTLWGETGCDTRGAARIDAGDNGVEGGQGDLRRIGGAGQICGCGESTILMRGLVLVWYGLAAIMMDDGGQRDGTDHQTLGIGHPASGQHRAHQKRNDSQMAKAARNPLHVTSFAPGDRTGQANAVSQWSP